MMKKHLKGYTSADIYKKTIKKKAKKGADRSEKIIDGIVKKAVL